METYVPYPDIEQIADSLHPADIRVSVITAMRVLDVAHEIEKTNLAFVKQLPTVRMWLGHEVFLYEYATQLNSRRETGRLPARTQQRLDEHLSWATSGDFSMDPPRWWGEERLHAAHRAELFRSNPNFYGKRFGHLVADAPMFWPVG